MIARLQGEVIEKMGQAVILNVQSVGYAIAVVDENAYSLGQPADMYIYYHWNQENGPQLYGFQDALAKTVFGLILSCSGCGPKVGLAVLGHMSAHEFLSTVTVGNAAALSEVHGIGAKKAEMIIMQLKDKVAKMDILPVAHKHETLIKIRQVQEALAALRYKPAEITKTVEYLHKQNAIETSPLDELLKKGLSFLAKRM